MKTQYRIINKGKGVLNIAPVNLHKVEQPTASHDILEVANLISLPITGETGKIYIAIDSSKQYRWSGTIYIQITNGLIGSTTDVPEGSNLYFTLSRVLNAVLTGISFATNRAVTATDTLLVALGLLQKQATDNATNIGLKQDTLVSGTNIKTINGSAILGSGNLVTPDMDTTSGQTISGLKIFLSGMFGLRNIANTFTSLFTNSNTAARTYTLQNRDGVLLDNTDLTAINASLATKQSVFSGVANYLVKSLNATTLIPSRIFDNGTFLGIGTFNAPTKDLTFGNQADREIGIEQSNSSASGRNLTQRAGRTINFTDNVNFNLLTQTVQRTFRHFANHPNGDVYATNGNSLFKQNNGTGEFNIVSTPGITSISGLDISTTSDIYISGVSTDLWKVFKQTNSAGSFNQIGQDILLLDLAIAPNGDLYGVPCYIWNFGTPGDIWKLTGGVGSFVAQGQSVQRWNSIKVATNGDVFACNFGTGVFKQTGGVGTYINIAASFNVVSVNINQANDLFYLNHYGESILSKQNNSTGSFVVIADTFPDQPLSIGNDNDGNLYVSTYAGTFYQQNYAVGAPNLNGGKLTQAAGTGKGEGESRVVIATGQKTASGTNMQIETPRMEFDETGAVLLLTNKIYADNAAAIAGGERLKTIYWTATGEMRIVI